MKLIQKKMERHPLSPADLDYLPISHVVMKFILPLRDIKL